MTDYYQLILILSQFYCSQKEILFFPTPQGPEVPNEGHIILSFYSSCYIRGFNPRKNPFSGLNAKLFSSLIGATVFDPISNEKDASK